MTLGKCFEQEDKLDKLGYLLGLSSKDKHKATN